MMLVLPFLVHTRITLRGYDCSENYVNPKSGAQPNFKLKTISKIRKTKETAESKH